LSCWRSSPRGPTKPDHHRDQHGQDQDRDDDTGQALYELQQPLGRLDPEGVVGVALEAEIDWAGVSRRPVRYRPRTSPRAQATGRQRGESSRPVGNSRTRNGNNPPSTASRCGCRVGGPGSPRPQSRRPRTAPRLQEPRSTRGWRARRWPGEARSRAPGPGRPAATGPRQAGPKNEDRPGQASALHRTSVRGLYCQVVHGAPSGSLGRASTVTVPRTLRTLAQRPSMVCLSRPPSSVKTPQRRTTRTSRSRHNHAADDNAYAG
jgi:hypothetical protein